MKYMKTLILPLIFSVWMLPGSGLAQDDVNPRPITMEEYEKALTYEIGDLNNDTYIKFENAYILDRYELKKPIFITGDDGLRKRMDLYKLIAREGLQELGVMVFYTNESGTQFKALIPNYTASGEVWERHFEDIHDIDRKEDNFVLKLSYVLSREFAFQMYKNLNGGSVDENENPTYGTDICFPGDQLVWLADGSSKALKDITEGDKLISVDPVTKLSRAVNVSRLIEHTPENYALTVLTVVSADRSEKDTYLELNMSLRQIKATPNHPMLTNSGSKTIGEVKAGEFILSWNEEASEYSEFEVLSIEERVDGIQPVYSIESDEGTTLIMNGVMVKQKN